MTRASMWVLLAVVSAAAAVLSFASLRDLAGLCGFSSSLAWLLPVVVDAGAAAGATIWLSGHAPDSAQSYARTLTLTLLAASVLGNGVVHYLTAYGLRPAWWLVVAVSAVAPSVLGAVVHLSVLVGRPTLNSALVVASPPQSATGERGNPPVPPPVAPTKPAQRKRAPRQNVPSKGRAKTPAERQKEYRERRKAEAAELEAMLA